MYSCRWQVTRGNPEVVIVRRHKKDAWPGGLAEPIRLALAQPWDVISGFVGKVLVIGELVKAFVTLKQGVQPSDELRLDLMGFARTKLGSAVAPNSTVYGQLTTLAGIMSYLSARVR
jgi:hypothetical protein